MRIQMVGTFGLRPKMTVSKRAVPLARALAARGHEVEVLVPPWDDPDSSGLTTTVDGVTIRNISLPRKWSLLFHALVTWRLCQQALCSKPDVVYCFKPKAYAGLVALGVWLRNHSRCCRVGLVIDTDDWEGSGGWNDLQHYPWLARRLFAWQERWCLRHADSVTTASRGLEEIALGLGVRRSRLRYLPNGVAMSSQGASRAASMLPASIAARIPSGATVLLLYTRFFEYSLEYLLDIVCRVAAGRPAMRVLVVGSGLFGEEERLAAIARTAGMADTFVFAGWVSEDELPSYLAAGDVAIYPFADTMINRTKCSVKLLDLMLAGKAIVADAVGQNREYLENGRSGFLVAPGDSDAFAYAIEQLLEDPQLRESLGRAALVRASTLFNWADLARIAEAACEDSTRR